MNDGADMAMVAYRLGCLGYPPVLAMRVATTPPLSIGLGRDADDGSRPGRELHEYVELHVGQVVSLVAAAATPARRQL